jgi:hypothetical protein
VSPETKRMGHLSREVGHTSLPCWALSLARCWPVAACSRLNSQRSFVRPQPCLLALLVKLDGFGSTPCWKA